MVEILNVFDWRPTSDTVFVNVTREPGCDVLSVATVAVRTVHDGARARAPNGPCAVYGKSARCKTSKRVAQQHPPPGGCFSIEYLKPGLEYMLLDSRFEFRDRTACEVVVNPR